ncbi:MULTISPECIES: M20 family metallo-hydrolase [Rhodonellum]|uniref:M20 family metallo-hydrolase n=1 Tax=Rhodonellum TaxID=336827 RepID=UPI0003A4A4A9|nr:MULTISPECIES: M20 family metallo-hydrolase [Rhodonellum]
MNSSNNLTFSNLGEEAIALLKSLIETVSFSKEEEKSADLIQDFFEQRGIITKRENNNVIVFNKFFDPLKPSILLNSHHDTVKPNAGYTKDPFKAIVEDGKLFGLGSNDAGGCLVSLIAAFLVYYDQDLPYNLVMAATAEEEISGQNGIESILSQLPEFELAIVGEPTLLQMAVAEKGLMVIDAEVKGMAGHAARNEGDNAIYKALDDLNLIRSYKFQKISPYLGETKVTATILQAGSQHNVVPDICRYTLDVRITDSYTLEEILAELKQNLSATLTPRSMRLKSSHIPENHPILAVGKSMNMDQYGSPTLSDQALIPYPSVKIGPGDSARSHSPDEFIFLEEIQNGIKVYVELLDRYMHTEKS